VNYKIFLGILIVIIPNTIISSLSKFEQNKRVLNIKTYLKEDSTGAMFCGITVLKKGFAPKDTIANIDGIYEYCHENMNKNKRTMFIFTYAGCYPLKKELADLVKDPNVYLESLKPENQIPYNGGDIETPIDTLQIRLNTEMQTLKDEWSKKYNK
jgi:hypothetical protein